MYLFRSIIILMVLFVFTVLGQAREIHIATDTWEGYSNKDGTGYYLEILKEIYPPPNYTLKISYVPFKRALYMVEGGKADITVGVNRGDIDDDFIAEPIVENDKVDIIVHKQLAQKWQGLDSLKDKKIVAKIGYGFDKNIKVPIDYTEITTLLSMMRMLSIGRIDAVLDYNGDIKKLWRESGLDENYTIIKAVLTNQAYFAFARGQQDLKKHFEKTFQTLVQSGKILELGKKNGLEENQLPQPK